MEPFSYLIYDVYMLQKDLAHNRAFSTRLIENKRRTLNMFRKKRGCFPEKLVDYFDYEIASFLYT